MLVRYQPLRANTVPRFSRLEVHNLQVNRFRILLHRPKQGLEVFNVVEVCFSEVTASAGAKADLLNENDAELRELLKELEEFFQEALTDGLPSKRDLEHAIEMLVYSPTPSLVVSIIACRAGRCLPLRGQAAAVW